MAASARFNVVSPIGRIVSGDPWKASEKDADGQLRVYKSGPNVGQPNPQFYIGLAVPKLINGQPNADWASFYAFVESVAKAAWPNLFPGGGPCIAPAFAWKITDGDGVTKQGKNAGKPNSRHAGYAGHWIINFASSFKPQCVIETAPGQYGEITDENLLKRGYYARVGGSISGNDSVQTPGLYMNLEKIELKGIGEVITSGISAAEAFGGAAAGAVPEGMQALPAGFAAGVPAGLGAGPAGGAPTAPAAPMAAAALPPTAAPIMLPAANGVTYEAYRAAGWTDEALISGGLMVPPPLAPGAPAPMPLATPGPAAPFAAPAPAPVALAAPAFAPPAPAPTISPTSGFMGGVPVMLPAANGVTYDAYRAQGWTDELLVQHGMMAAR